LRIRTPWTFREERSKERRNTQRLEFFVEREGASSAISFFRVAIRFLGHLGAGHDTSLLIVGDALLEEVGLAAERDVLHKVKGIGDLVKLLIAKRDKEAIGNKLNVLLHQGRVHAQERAGKGLGEELLLNLDGIQDNVLDELLAGTVLQVRVEQAGEVGVETLVTGDELVGEGEAGHEATLLEPEDGGESTAEEDAFDRGEGDEALSEGGVAVLDPANGPVGLLANAGDYNLGLEERCKYSGRKLTGINGVEEMGPLGRLLDVGVDEERVGLGVNVLHHDLEAVEAASFGNLDLAAEALDQVLVDDTVRGSKEGENVRDEELLAVIDAVVPVVEILAQINLLGCPERSLGLLVKLPDLLCHLLATIELLVMPMFTLLTS